MRELHMLFGGYAVSDVLIVLAAFGIGMWQMVLRASRVVPPDRQVVSQVLMLVMIFLFETAYQVYLGIPGNRPASRATRSISGSSRR